MPVYEMAPEEVYDMVALVMERYHGPLHDAGVTVDCLLAHPSVDDNGDSTGPALKKNGYPCAALVKVNSHKDRVKGARDAEIVIDAERWEEFSYEEREALIDHELEHLELRHDKDGNIARDDQDRPKLRIRPHDREIGWFDAVVRRHGVAALEFQGLQQINESLRQLHLPFADSDAA